MLGFSFLVVGDDSSGPALTPATKTLEAIDRFVQSKMQILQILGLALGIVEGDRRNA